MPKSKYSQLPVILIDKPLEKFSCSPDVNFANIFVIACGFFYQLSQIEQRPVYVEFHNGMLNISNFWRLCKIPEVTEVTRQSFDETLITLLNNIRPGNITKNQENILLSKFIEKSDHIYCKKTFYIWAKIAAVEEQKNVDSLPNSIVP